MKRFQSILVVMITFLAITHLIYAEDQIPSKEIDLTIDDASIDYYSNNNPFQSKRPEVEPVKIIDQENIYAIKDPIPEDQIEQQIPVQEPVKPIPPTLILKGIVWDTDRPQAIINDQVLSQGDIIEGARIVSIRKSGINLVFQDVNFTLKP